MRQAISDSSPLILYSWNAYFFWDEIEFAKSINHNYCSPTLITKVAPLICTLEGLASSQQHAYELGQGAFYLS